jgi:ribose-phosphate pyrophosphokinase
MNKKLRIFTGTSHPKLAGMIAKELGVELSEMDIKKFSCGEIYAKSVESVRGDDVYVIQTGTGNANEELVELFIVLDSLKRSFAGKIHVVIPHFAYARQDRVASPREPISARLMARLIEKAGADHVICIGLHSSQIQGFFHNPMDNISASTLFVDYFKQKNIDNLVVVSPDAGGAKEAKKFADELDAGLAILNKTRPEHNEAEITHVVGDVAGMNCIIFDDMIDTAGSVCNAKKALEAEGVSADSIYLAATHPVFSGPAYGRLKEAGFKEIVVTDTIPLDESQAFEGIKVLSVANLISRIIDSVHNQKSVTSNLIQ